jgi:hypothetical protein
MGVYDDMQSGVLDFCFSCSSQLKELSLIAFARSTHGKITVLLDLRIPVFAFNMFSAELETALHFVRDVH